MPATEYRTSWVATDISGDSHQRCRLFSRPDSAERHYSRLATDPANSELTISQRTCGPWEPYEADAVHLPSTNDRSNHVSRQLDSSRVFADARDVRQPTVSHFGHVPADPTDPDPGR